MKIRFRFRYILLIICLGICLFSGWKIYDIYAEYREGEKSYQTITDRFVSEFAPGEASAAEEESVPAASLDMEPPGETAPIDVDFDAMLELCPDVVGWIYCPDTPINYPVVQAKDNNYYLRRLLDGSYNSSGTIFVDYRNASDFSDWNTIIYGHNMDNDSMFGTLQDYKSREYYEAHPVMYMLTPDRDYKIDLIGGYVTPDSAEDTYRIPVSQEELDVLTDKAKSAGPFQKYREIADGRRIITLSTCDYEYYNARYVLIGVLEELYTE